ncbi:hypothetical protein [Alteromonas stellipolaris]|uniref:hypothetical protein n=1 Tax=Alteromonas stellipolaris TaxID=233316 RepID=UPI0026E2F6C9|nr:hypothetical protein [Alteromonas stellipolaris]MDO6534828.1 hypothetical protein [Alteromonas stellipolaris]MDO6626705.1 hypothetical protein [Alteromonas stellipolaris]
MLQQNSDSQLGEDLRAQLGNREHRHRSGDNHIVVPNRLGRKFNRAEPDNVLIIEHTRGAVSCSRRRRPDLTQCGGLVDVSFITKYIVLNALLMAI